MLAACARSGVQVGDVEDGVESAGAGFDAEAAVGADLENVVEEAGQRRLRERALDHHQCQMRRHSPPHNATSSAHAYTQTQQTRAYETNATHTVGDNVV